MSISRRVVALFDHRLARRLIIVPLTVVAAALAVVSSPVLLGGGLIADLRGHDLP